MKTTRDIHIMVSVAVAAMLFFVSLLISENTTANMAGDENQLPENEVFLNLAMRNNLNEK